MMSENAVKKAYKVVNGVKDNQEFLHEPHDFFYNNEALTRKTVVVNGVTRI